MFIGWVASVLNGSQNSSELVHLFFRLSRRRREKLQAHLKENRSLKNYTANSHNALDAKMRAPNTNLQMHEVTTAALACLILTFFQSVFFFFLLHLVKDTCVCT